MPVFCFLVGREIKHIPSLKAFSKQKVAPLATCLLLLPSLELVSVKDCRVRLASYKSAQPYQSIRDG
jgi:hypothetical protein